MLMPVMVSFAEGDEGLPLNEPLEGVENQSKYLRTDYREEDLDGTLRTLNEEQINILNEVEDCILSEPPDPDLDVSGENEESVPKELLKYMPQTMGLYSDGIYTNAYKWPNNPRAKIDVILYDVNGNGKYHHSYEQGRLAHLSSSISQADASNYVEDVFCQLSWFDFKSGRKTGKKASSYDINETGYMPQRIENRIALSLYYFDNFYADRNNLPPHYDYFFKQCIVWYWANSYYRYYDAHDGRTIYEVGNGVYHNGRNVLDMYMEYFWGALKYAEEHSDYAIGNVYVYKGEGQPVCTWDVSFKPGLITVEKEWDDCNNADKLRPKEIDITVETSFDGVNFGQTPDIHFKLGENDAINTNTWRKNVVIPADKRLGRKTILRVKESPVNNYTGNSETTCGLGSYAFLKNKEIYKYKLIVNKYETGDLNYVEDVTFKLSSPGKEDYNKNTMWSGKAIFYNLTDGEYTLTEARHPYTVVGNDGVLKFEIKDGHYNVISNTGGHSIELMGSGNTGIVKFMDKPNLMRLTVKKINDQGTNLPGAEFALYKDENCQYEVCRKVTDKYGEAQFDNIYPNKIYYVKETKAPDGYAAELDSSGGTNVLKVEYRVDFLDSRKSGLYVNDKYEDGPYDYGAIRLLSISKYEKMILGTIKVVNHPAALLPRTGNFKRSGILFSGIILMTVSLLIFRKKENKN